MILIGSRAMALRMPQILKRQPVDFDWVCTLDEYQEWMKKNSDKVNPTKMYELPEYNKFIVEGTTNCEFEIIKPDTSNELLADLVSKDPDTFETPFGKIPSLDLLFTIKDSHKYKKFGDSPNHFWKNTLDWHRMNSIGAKVRPEYQEFLKLREKETYTYLHPKLNTTKDQFFQDDGIKYEVEHDDIHESVKRFDKPAYAYYLKDDEEVLCDKSKFFNISHSIRIAGVVEEAATLAIERSLIPHGTWTAKQAWVFALAKVCTSITSGWFRKFAFENVFEVLNNYPEGYWEKFQQDRASGKVRPFSGKK